MLRTAILAFLVTALAATSSAQSTVASPRPRVGVAFGGGSARGLAHVGVIRWLEEHRVPIDFVAGTSMGGLVGGAYASGMSSSELAELLARTDWDAVFGSTAFRYKNVRRKQDARAYPSRLEFGYRRGIVAPPALNDGRQVDLLLARIAGAYPALQTFDELPTPFRCVAVDLVTARPIVLDHGWLAEAMRATMSLPGVFPPVELDGQVLVDGGSMDNVPVDVVRRMGADVVIAVAVGQIGDRRDIDFSLHALPGETIDAMMRASGRVALGSADVVINPAREFGKLDWRKSAQLEADGYAAAAAMGDRLLPLALDEKAWAAHQSARAARRRREAAAPAFVTVTGATPATRPAMERALRGFVGRPLDVRALDATLERFAGLDRYETVRWRLASRDGRDGLDIVARQKRHAPPFFMFGVTVDNTATDLFTFQLAARYLAFDVAGPESELRIDAAVGARPNVAIALRRPLGGTALFVAPALAAARRTWEVVGNGAILAAYEERRARLGLDLGLDLGRDDEVRAGAAVDYLSNSIRVGNPGLPELHGVETRARVRWVHDGQDSPVIPSSGAHTIGTVDHLLTTPDPDDGTRTSRTNRGLTKAELTTSVFATPRAGERLFVVAGAGTSFDGAPLLTEQYELGRPLRLGAYDVGEVRGSHYALATVGYLWQVGRLPDFLGGPAFAGGWLENGSAFEELESARLYTVLGVGAVASTIVGPAIMGASVSRDGRWRTFLGIGRIF